MLHSPMPAALGLLFWAASASVLLAAKPPAQTFRQLVREIWQYDLRADPLFATRVGDHRYDDRLPSVAVADWHRRRRDKHDFLQRLQAIASDELPPAERVNYRILARLLKDEIAEMDFGGFLMPITNLSGFHVEFPELRRRVRLATVRDYENYIARLRAFDRYADQHIELLRAGLAAGRVLPAVVLEGYAATIEPHLVTDPARSLLFEPFAAFPSSFPQEAQERLAEAGRRAILEHVVPGYRRFLAFLRSEYVPGARNSVGASALPDGRAFYRHRVGKFTTLELTPDEVHATGLKEVQRIRGEMQQVIDQVGFAGDFAAFVDMLRTDDRFYARSADELMKEVSYILKRMDGQLPTLFQTLPRMPYGIRRVPDYIAPRTTTAYYMRPAGDGSRAGFYYVNTFDLHSRPLYEIEALSLHEAVPGHHLQLALQQELTDLPPFRRFAGFTAFVEGWALYAERLGLEVGFYRDPYRNFGRLSYEIWRACRLVVDTGIHYFGWTRQQAIDYMTANTALTPHNIRAEVDRYISWPGQALAYKMGELKIRALRRSAEDRLGTRFSLRQFHSAVLGGGSVPLDVLAEQVEQYIERVLAATTVTGNDAISYPATKRVDHVDVYHGQRVVDPYRWLEADVRHSDAVAAWVAAENKVTSAYLQSIPQRPAIRKRLTELWDFEKYSSPFQRGGKLFYFKNNGLQNQSVLYTTASLDTEPRTLIDPNKWSADGTVALADVQVSDNAKYAAYGVAEAGSDWQTWRVLEVDTGRRLAEQLKWVKFSSVAWTKDQQGFFYARYDEPKSGEEFRGVNLNQKVYYHRIDTPQEADTLQYERPDHPDWGFGVEVTEDGRYLVLTIWKGTDDKYRIAVKDLADAHTPIVDLIDDFANQYSFVGSDGSRLFFITDLEAPRKRIVALDLAAAGRAPEQLVPQAEETLIGASVIHDQFVLSYLQDAVTQVRIHALTGAYIRSVEFPALGSASGFDGRRSDTVTYYSFSSFATPPSIYRYDLTTGASQLVRQPRVKFDPDAYEVEQVFYESKDGTRVPMFLARKKGLPPDRPRPTLLYGYGGFAIPLTPRFSVSRLAWMELGGLFAMANLRGGGEYGEAWHRAGTRLNKQNVFDDFLAAAEWLIDRGYTSPEKLAIQGGSNGGLLVGAAMTQRPDLFGACLPAVGVMDMLRFHKFTAGRFWVDDYGSSDDPDQFRALRAYSPYHNVKKGTRYPATLITTADTDDRVVPGHSFKFAAALQYAQAGPAPVLIRIETRAGHGAGKPTRKVIDEITDQWAFLVKTFGMQPAFDR